MGNIPLLNFPGVKFRVIKEMAVFELIITFKKSINVLKINLSCRSYLSALLNMVNKDFLIFKSNVM